MDDNNPYGSFEGEWMLLFVFKPRVEAGQLLAELKA